MGKQLEEPVVCSKHCDKTLSVLTRHHIRVNQCAKLYNYKQACISVSMRCWALEYPPPPAWRVTFKKYAVLTFNDKHLYCPIYVDWVWWYFPLASTSAGSVSTSYVISLNIYHAHLIPAMRRVNDDSQPSLSHERTHARTHTRTHAHTRLFATAFAKS